MIRLHFTSNILLKLIFIGISFTAYAQMISEKIEVNQEERR